MTEPELVLGYPALKHLPPLTPTSHQVADQPRLEPSNYGGHIPSQGTQFPVDNSDFFRILSCLKHCHSFFSSFTGSCQWPTTGIFSIYTLFYPIIVCLEGEKNTKYDNCELPSINFHLSSNWYPSKHS